MSARIEHQIEEIVSPMIADMGYEIVRTAIFTDSGTRVQIMIERPDGRAVSVDDCQEVSEAVSALLDVEDVFENSWNLEISSPGMDRPLTRLKDWERFGGYRVQLVLKEPHDGHKKFQATACGLKDGKIVISLKKAAYMYLDLSEIQSAHIVITQDLIRQALRAAKRQEKKGTSISHTDGDVRVH